MDYIYVSCTGRVTDTPVVKRTSDGKPRKVFKLKSESPGSDGGEVIFDVILFDEASEVEISRLYEISITGAKMDLRKGKPTLKIRGSDAFTVRVLSEFDLGKEKADSILK